jgi:hypothetical protein
MEEDKKIKIIGISKNNSRTQLTFPKEQKLFSILREFLRRLQFDEDEEYGIQIIGRQYKESEGKYDLSYEDDISKYNESIESYKSKDYSVDIIYFSEKVVVILNYFEDMQKEIGDALENLIKEEK